MDPWSGCRIHTLRPMIISSTNDVRLTSLPLIDLLGGIDVENTRNSRAFMASLPVGKVHFHLEQSPWGFVREQYYSSFSRWRHRGKPRKVTQLLSKVDPTVLSIMRLFGKPDSVQTKHAVADYMNLINTQLECGSAR